MIRTVSMHYYLFIAQLFLMYMHLTGGKEIQPTHVIVGIIRISLYSVDMAFTFLSSNKLKQEVN